MIFAGASCCMRGVALSAAECGALDRFSVILVKEDDLFGGKMEKMLIDGVSKILDALGTLPPCVVLFSGCIHETAGNDMDYVQSALASRYPEVDFIMSKMNPTMRKSGITPEELMRMQLYAPLGRRRMPSRGIKAVNIIGNIAPRSENSEVLAMLKEAGYTVKDLCLCKNYDEYLDMANASMNVYMSPVAEKGAAELSKRLGIRLFYFPVTFDMSTLEKVLSSFASELSLKLPDIPSLKEKANAALKEARAAALGWKVAADFSAVSRPFELCRLLFESGFDVRKVYTDSIAAGDEEACVWCKENIPCFEIISVTNAASRFIHNEEMHKEGEDGSKWLAIGQKTAYFCNTRHFINIIENGSLWGFSAITQMAQMIKEAVEHESDMQGIIQVKAWGCAESCASLSKCSPSNANRCLPSTYSADLFGMCNALCELGGLVVMHDASGCNSTYCTHDEPRWFDTDSMIYISALTEEDIILGRDEKLIDDIQSAVQAAKEKAHPPRFIAIGGSPMPFMVGCDMAGIARSVEKRTGLPTLALECGGMRDYTVGAGAAFKWLADTFCLTSLPPSERLIRRASLPYKRTMNILGLTPLDFATASNAAAIKDLFARDGAHIISTWAMGTSIEEIKNAGLADVNAVVSATGFAAAKRLFETYGTPYVMGIPFGKDAVDAMLPLHLDDAAVFNGALIIGEAVMASSLRKCLREYYGAQGVRLLCPLEETAGLLEEGDIHTDDEERIINAMQGACTIIADPLYRRALQKGSKARFIDLPHTAYSGRMFADKMQSKNGYLV